METARNNNCYQWASCEGEQGEVLTRSIFFERRGSRYSIRVGTPDIIEKIKRENTDYPPDERSDELIFPFDDVSDLDVICQRLQEESLELLRPYITEQK